MKLSIKELLEATKGELIKGDNADERVVVSTDTRTITSGNIYLPLIGANFDGHNYINEAVSKGCKGFFINKTNEIPNYSAEFVISVDDTLTAYLRIARYARRKINPKVVAVTGSSGKTTTKEFIASVLQTKFVTHKSAFNHNNEIGLCKTLLAMPEDCEYVVVEMGMRGLGEIELLSKYSEPDIAIITNVGTAHIGRLGSVENIARAKCEIAAYLNNDGNFIAPDDDLINKYCEFSGKQIFLKDEYEIINQGDNITEFIYKNEQFSLPVAGKFNVINSIFAIEIALLAGMSHEAIRQGLMNYVPVGERGKIVDYKGAKFILDCYNANPESVTAAIDSVIDTYKGFDIVLVLGDMAELGEQEEYYHRKIGHYISGKPINLLITVGEKAKFIAEAASININSISLSGNPDAAIFLKNNLNAKSVVLFKASRCIKLEEILNYLN